MQSCTSERRRFWRSNLEGGGGTETQRRRVNWSATSQWLEAGSSGSERPSGGG